MKVSKTILWFIVTSLGLIVSSCSSDEPKPEIDNDVVSAFRSGKVSKSFKLVDIDCYERNDSQSKWEYTGSPSSVIFMGSYNPIVFADGKVLVPFLLTERVEYRSQGHYETIWLLSEVLSVYRKMTDNKEKPYVGTPFEFEISTNSFAIKDEQYSVEKMTDKELCISHNVDKSGTHKWQYRYEAYYMLQHDRESIVAFDSDKDAAHHIVTVAREYFGDTVDLNKYNDTDGKNNLQVIDLDDLERKIDLYM